MMYHYMLILTAVTNILGLCQYVLECKGGLIIKDKLCLQSHSALPRGGKSALFTYVDVFTTFYSKIPTIFEVVAVPFLIEVRPENG